MGEFYYCARLKRVYMLCFFFANMYAYLLQAKPGGINNFYIVFFFFFCPGSNIFFGVTLPFAKKLRGEKEGELICSTLC